MCKIDVGTRQHQVTPVEPATLPVSRQLYLVIQLLWSPLPSWAAGQCVAQGNRCLKPENLPPCPSLCPKRTKDPGSLTLLSEAACFLGGLRARVREKVRMRGRQEAEVGYLPVRVSQSPLCSLEITYAGWGCIRRNKTVCDRYPAGVKWPWCNVNWSRSPRYMLVSAELRP